MPTVNIKIMRDLSETDTALIAEIQAKCFEVSVLAEKVGELPYAEGPESAKRLDRAKESLVDGFARLEVMVLLDVTCS